MTKDEVLKLALEALEDLGMKHYEITGEVLYKDTFTAIKEALAQPEPNYKKALEVWLDKTEWVQKTVKPHELGMHRADVLKQRIEESLAEPEPWEKFCDSNCVWTDHHPDCKLTQRTWVGLTDDEQQQAYEQWQNDGWGVFYNAIEAKLKEKNT